MGLWTENIEAIQSGEGINYPSELKCKINIIYKFEVNTT